MANLFIRKVYYIGANYEFESPYFENGINIIEAKNGSGKTTFSNLIYFCLGGKVESFIKTDKNNHVEIVNDKNNYIKLEVEIKNKPYILIRKLTDNSITVIDSENDKNVKIYPISRSGEVETFSDWILKKLDIDIIRLFLSNTDFILGIKDILRLVYYDQNIDENDILKKPDEKKNYVNDSKEIRNVIFQVLVGEVFVDYYKAFSDFKRVESERKLAKSVIEEYKNISDQLLEEKDESENLKTLNDRFNEISLQIERLYVTRSLLKKTRINTVGNDIELLKEEILVLEQKLILKKKNYYSNINEINSFGLLKTEVQQEIDQIKKIIFTHENLELFNPDTCPYCLTKIDRKIGHCVCGSPVVESQYERFFYDSNEYTELYKIKDKSLETIEVAILATNKDIETIQKEIDYINELITKKNELVNKKVKIIDNEIDLERLDQIDDKIISLKEKIIVLSQKIAIEEKIDKNINELNKVDSRFVTYRNKKDSLLANANDDMKSKVEIFNKIYRKFMMNTISTCKDAKIDYYDYSPIINGGDYINAAFHVNKRLLYFLTIFALSLENEKIKYPKFLLVDTPQAKGIDPDNFLNLINEINKIEEIEKGQIIISTGIGMYPANMKEKVVLYLNKDEGIYLLTKKNSL